jgi:hypothetical protein
LRADGYEKLDGRVVFVLAEKSPSSREVGWIFNQDLSTVNDVSDILAGVLSVEFGWIQLFVFTLISGYSVF